MSIHQMVRIRVWRPLVSSFLVALLLWGCSEPPRPTVNLYRAIHTGDLDQIKRHLYWGTAIDRPGPDGDLPLHVAARRGRVVIARTLLEHGAPVDARNARGQTPIEVALRAGKVQVAALLLQKGAAPHPQDWLFQLARSGSGDRDSLAFVLRQGASLREVDASGATALHIAVARQDPFLVKRLLILGAPVNALDGQGRTPLDLAGSIESENAQDIIELLRSYGATTETTQRSKEP